MPAWNGLRGLKALPTIAAPALIAATVTASYPNPHASTTSTGTSGMISSCMFSSAPQTPNAMQMSPTTRWRRRANRPTSPSTIQPSVPARSTTVHAPPTRSTSTTTSAAAITPRGTATNAAKTPTGAGSTR
jgi:hypothetical protein